MKKNSSKKFKVGWILVFLTYDLFQTNNRYDLLFDIFEKHPEAIENEIFEYLLSDILDDLWLLDSMPRETLSEIYDKCIEEIERQHPDIKNFKMNFSFEESKSTLSEKIWWEKINKEGGNLLLKKMDRINAKKLVLKALEIDMVSYVQFRIDDDVENSATDRINNVLLVNYLKMLHELKIPPFSKAKLKPNYK